jgi:GntR family transcriptional regulator / MocR family aminotransferase
MTASFGYESLPIASLQGLDSDSRVIYIGTFSKVLFPSLRVGYIVIPSDPVERFHAIRRVMDLSPHASIRKYSRTLFGKGFCAPHPKNVGSLRRAKDCVGSQPQERTGPFGRGAGDEAGMHVTVMLQNGKARSGNR